MELTTFRTTILLSLNSSVEDKFLIYNIAKKCFAIQQEVQEIIQHDTE
jgi:hypothetical protein